MFNSSLLYNFNISRDPGGVSTLVHQLTSFASRLTLIIRNSNYIWWWCKRNIVIILEYLELIKFPTWRSSLKNSDYIVFLFCIPVFSVIVVKDEKSRLEADSVIFLPSLNILFFGRFFRELDIFHFLKKAKSKTCF